MLLHMLRWEHPGGSLHAGLLGSAVAYPVKDKHNPTAPRAPGFVLEGQVRKIE